MSPKFSPEYIRTVLLIFCTLCAACFFSFQTTSSQTLPLKTYSSADGLASSVIHRISRDSQGFIWFAARGGLSRFDGYEFTRYRFSNQEAPQLVHTVLETHDGVLWIGANDGLYRVERTEATEVKPASGTIKNGVRLLNTKKVSNHSFWCMFEDKQNRLWVGLHNFFLVENRDADKITLKEYPFNTQENKDDFNSSIRDIIETKDGSIWIAMVNGTCRLLPDGRWIEYSVPHIPTFMNPFSIIEDHNGLIWCAHSTGVFIFKPDTIDELSGLLSYSVRSYKISDQEINNYGTIKYPTSPGVMLKLKFSEEKSLAGGRAANSSVEKLFQSSDVDILPALKARGFPIE